jgi:hypothetical protein
MIFKYISFPAFIISFLIGIFMVYLWGPEIKTIVVHPTPENSEKIIYQDKTNTCYIYKSEEISCPDNKNDIKEIPIEN